MRFKKLLVSSLLFSVISANAFAVNFNCPSSGDIKNLNFVYAMYSDYVNKWVLTSQGFTFKEQLWVVRVTTNLSVSNEDNQAALAVGKAKYTKMLMLKEPVSGTSGECTFNPAGADYEIVASRLIPLHG